jgi:hypothetical protein
MKKLLFVGNSHLGTLYYYYKFGNGDSLINCEADFIGYPGGWGPPFILNENKLDFIRESKNKLIQSSGFDFNDHDLNLYDSIIISAVGHCGDLETPFVGLKSGCLYKFLPKIPNEFGVGLISEDLFMNSCYHFYEMFDMVKFIISISNRKS